MSNHDTGFIKILVLLFCLGLIQLTSGCSRFESAADKNSISNHKLSGILNGVKVFENDALAKKVFYLSVNSNLIKTPLGFAARQDSFCTAVAIAPAVLLTAAHCVQDILPEYLNVIEGVSPWLSTLNPEKWHGVDRYLINPKYKRGKPLYDLAILHLAVPLAPDAVVAIDQPTYENANLILAGYGYRVAQKPMAKPEIIDSKNSAGELFFVTKFLKNYDLNSPTFSFENTTGERVCLGDSGGPALLYDAQIDEFKVLGLLSGSVELQRIKRFHNFTGLNPGGDFDFCSDTIIYSNLKHPLIHQWIEDSMIQLLQSK